MNDLSSAHVGPLEPKNRGPRSGFSDPYPLRDGLASEWLPWQLYRIEVDSVARFYHSQGMKIVLLGEN